MVCKLLALCVISKCFITVFSLPEIIKVLVLHEEVKFMYAGKFNQDPVKHFWTVKCKRTAQQ